MSHPYRTPEERPAPDAPPSLGEKLAPALWLMFAAVPEGVVASFGAAPWRLLFAGVVLFSFGCAMATWTAVALGKKIGAAAERARLLIPSLREDAVQRIAGRYFPCDAGTCERRNYQATSTGCVVVEISGRRRNARVVFTERELEEPASLRGDRVLIARILGALRGGS